ncbi:antitoxin [Spirochaetia bacterium]|nr:antitoxin [Bacilli bacterium]GHU95629.1 antitoxin [Spirochaetia bacterium]
MAATAQISVKIDPKYKKIFETTAESLGLNASDAMRVMIKKFIDRGGFPFDVTNDPYSAETMTALRNAEAGVGLHKVKNLDELRNIMVG